MASTRMTKDQLRDALIEVGIRTPVKSKKADLVKLYREHVLNEKVCVSIQVSLFVRPVT